MKGHHAVAGLLVAAACVGCSPNPCSNSPDVQPVAFDVSGASNSACTIVVTNGDKTLTYDIPAPTPAVADTSLDTKPPPTFCSDGGVRSSQQLCFSGDAELNALAHARFEERCPLTVSLSCEGVTLYDRVPWHFCGEFC